MIRGIIVEDLERFENNKEAMFKLELQLLLANYRKLRMEKDGNLLKFYKKGKRFGIIDDDLPVYKLELDKIDIEHLELLDVAFNDTSKEADYDIKLTHTLGDYVFTLKPEYIDKDNSRFKFNAKDIIYGKIIRIYGEDGQYPMVDIEVHKDSVIRYIGVLTEFLFDDVVKAAEFVKRTPEDGFSSLNQCLETCSDLIEYRYKMCFGYSYKSKIDFDYINGYTSNKSTYTYRIFYDTDYDKAYTLTFPNAINTSNNKIYDSVTKCRADSIGEKGINISIGGNQVKLKSEKVNVAFHIEEL